MPRVFTATAAKDYPDQGIRKGDRYWFWTPYRGRKIRSGTYPLPSAVESNATRSSYLSLQEALHEDLQHSDTVYAIGDAVVAAHDEAIRVSEELREKAENIEDGFGHETEQSQLFNEQADDVETWAGDLENTDIPDEPGKEPVHPARKDFPEGEAGDEEYEGALNNYDEEYEDWKNATDAWEGAVDNLREDVYALLAEAPEI